MRRMLIKPTVALANGNYAAAATRCDFNMYSMSCGGNIIYSLQVFPSEIKLSRK
jgi:hypothetical protein